MSAPLLKAKLFMPHSRQLLVPRPRLFERLDRGRAGKLVLVSAPAGYGKTTLVSGWVRANPTPAAWLTLDRHDNDPNRFLTYLIAALQQIDGSIGRASLASLGARGSRPAEEALTGLIHDLAAFCEASAPAILVLDDYQAIASPEVREAVQFFLEYQPPRSLLVVVSRHDPDLPLARLRIRGDLAEIRAPDLRFHTEEITAFFQTSAGVALSPAEVSALEASTEGWIAGIQAVALSLGDRGASGDLLSWSPGSQPHVLDYLVDEVFQTQSEEVRRFLLRTSLLGRFCAALGDALMQDRSAVSRLPAGPPDPPEGADPRPAVSAQIIEHLNRSNLFIVPLDGEGVWYRYHKLFSGALASYLNRTDPLLVPEIHRRAARWLEAKGEFDEAVAHALDSGDLDYAGLLVEHRTKEILRRGEYRTLEGWLDALPEDLVRIRPRLCLARGWVHFYLGPLDLCEAWIRAAEEQADRIRGEGHGRGAGIEIDTWTGELAALRAMAASAVGDLRTTITQGEQALEHLREDDGFLDVTVLLAVGYAHRYSGEIQAALSKFEQAFAVSQKSGLTHQALDSLCNVANLQISRGRLRAAEGTLESAFRIFPPPLENLTALAGEVYILRGVLHYERNDLVAADQDFQRSIELSDRGGLMELSYAGTLWRSLARQAQGDLEGAQADIEASQQSAIRLNVERVRLHVDAAQARLAIALGDLDFAQEWAEKVERPGGIQGDHLLPIRVYELTTLAQVELTLGRPQASLALLEPVRRSAEEAGMLYHAHQMALLSAIALQAIGRTDEALGLLEARLPEVSREGYVRLFLDAGRPAFELLNRAIGRGVEVGYIRRLLTAAAPGAPPESLPPADLSPREIQVLELVAIGHSNGEIAETLVITPGTVKRHLFNIFRKLDVRSRTQAVARARSLGIL